MSPNTQKYLSYKEAWRRINASLDSGTYLEAIALCESIIADRLYSYIDGVSKMNGASQTKLKLHSPLHSIIKEWRKLAGSTLQQGPSVDLGKEVDNWRRERNEIIHGMVKSEPGTPTVEVSDFLGRAEHVAEQGRWLARSVSDWHSVEFAKSKKRVKKGTANKRASR